MIPFKTLLSTLLLASATRAADSLHVVDETIVTGSRLEIPSANTAAREKKDINPSETPCTSAQRSLYLARTCMTSLISTSLKVVSIAALRWAATRC